MPLVRWNSEPNSQFWLSRVISLGSCFLPLLPSLTPLHQAPRPGGEEFKKCTNAPASGQIGVETALKNRKLNTTGTKFPQTMEMWREILPDIFTIYLIRTSPSIPTYVDEQCEPNPSPRVCCRPRRGRRVETPLVNEKASTVWIDASLSFLMILMQAIQKFLLTYFLISQLLII